MRHGRYQRVPGPIANIRWSFLLLSQYRGHVVPAFQFQRMSVPSRYRHRPRPFGKFDHSSRAFRSLLRRLIVADPRPFDGKPQTGYPRRQRNGVVRMRQVLPGIHRLVHTLLMGTFRSLQD